MIKNKIFKTKDLYYLVFIVIGLLIALVSFILSYFISNYEYWSDWINIGLWISEFSGFLMLLLNGTFIKTKYLKYFKAIFAIILIGVILKLNHFSPYSLSIIVTGVIGLIITYFLSFLNKPIKKRLDYNKLIWVVIIYTSVILNILHLFKVDYLIPSAIMWLAIIDYLKTKIEKRTY